MNTPGDTMTATTAEVPHPHLTTLDDNGRLWAFRAVHPDFRSSLGYVWPFPGEVAKATGPFDPDNKEGCPSERGDGICLGLTWRGVASGSIPAITVLVCSYLPADLLGTEANGSKIRVKKCRVERVVDFPATLRGDVPADPLLPKANLSGADLSRADLSRADLSRADLSRADLSRADLYRADLNGADLNGADLSRANLRRADLNGADLSWADLSWANLYGADLRRADLNGADLNGADLSRADLHGADLRRANLSRASLSWANLYGANLSGADLSGANLSGADLHGADLHGADLSGADLSGAIGDALTILPPGYSIPPSGLIVRDGAA